MDEQTKIDAKWSSEKLGEDGLAFLKMLWLNGIEENDVPISCVSKPQQGYTKHTAKTVINLGMVEVDEYKNVFRFTMMGAKFANRHFAAIGLLDSWKASNQEIKPVKKDNRTFHHFRFMNEDSATKFAAWIASSATAKLRNIDLVEIKHKTTAIFMVDVDNSEYAIGVAEGIEYADYPKMYVEKY